MLKIFSIFPEPTARSAVRRGLLIPPGYLHPDKCEHSEVQSHRFCHGRFSSLCACASHHRFQKYGGLHEERTLAQGVRKGENEDKNDCHKTTRDTWEEINAGKRQRSAEKRFWIDTKQVCWYIVCTKPLRIYIKGRRSRIQSAHC